MLLHKQLAFHFLSLSVIKTKLIPYAIPVPYAIAYGNMLMHKWLTPQKEGKKQLELVGYAGFEPATSPLSGVRSDQLS
jgi:hypothetical protein